MRTARLCKRVGGCHQVWQSKGKDNRGLERTQDLSFGSCSKPLWTDRGQRQSRLYTQALAYRHGISHPLTQVQNSATHETLSLYSEQLTVERGHWRPPTPSTASMGHLDPVMSNSPEAGSEKGNHLTFISAFALHIL